MDTRTKPIPLFRSSCAKKIEARWNPRNYGVRPIIHNTIRWAYFFFLSPWNGVETPWRRWHRAYQISHKSESERRVPGKVLFRRLKQGCLQMMPGFFPKPQRHARCLARQGAFLLDSTSIREFARLQWIVQNGSNKQILKSQ